MTKYKENLLYKIYILYKIKGGSMEYMSPVRLWQVVGLKVLADIYGLVAWNGIKACEKLPSRKGLSYRTTLNECKWKINGCLAVAETESVCHKNAQDQIKSNQNVKIIYITYFIHLYTAQNN